MEYKTYLSEQNCRSESHAWYLSPPHHFFSAKRPERCHGLSNFGSTCFLFHCSCHWLFSYLLFFFFFFLSSFFFVLLSCFILLSFILLLLSFIVLISNVLVFCFPPLPLLPPPPFFSFYLLCFPPSLGLFELFFFQFISFALSLPFVLSSSLPCRAVPAPRPPPLPCGGAP